MSPQILHCPQMETSGAYHVDDFNLLFKGYGMFRTYVRILDALLTGWLTWGNCHLISLILHFLLRT